MTFVGMKAESDDDLMLRVKRRDESAFEALVHRHTQSIHAFVYRLTGDRSDAEDITQETFLRMWQRASKWAPGSVKFTTWLHQIARNLCIDEFRRARSKKRTVANDDQLVSDMPLDELEQSGRTIAMRQELSRLPERQRTALVLCQVQGWSQREAASVIGTTSDGIQALIGRARRTLRHAMLKRNERTTI